MSELNEKQMETLLSECRAYLGITWTDTQTDEQLKMFIKTSAKRIEAIFGNDLDFTEGEEAYDHLAHELLLTRVFYLREKGIDDFEGNFRGELLTLRNYGLIKRSEL